MASARLGYRQAGHTHSALSMAVRMDDVPRARRVHTPGLCFQSTPVSSSPSSARMLRKAGRGKKRR